MKKGTIVAILIILIVAIVGIVWWQAAKSPSAQPVAANPTIPSVPSQSTAMPPTPTPSAAEVTMVVLKTDPKLGSYLADNNGRTLYVFAKDADSGSSACSGGCLKAWPAFYLAKVSIGPGLDMGDFSTITRDDGSIQITYYGWPLYYYAGDVAPGDVKGEGFNKLWYVAKPDYTVLFANNNNTNYLVDAETGHTLYQFSKDTPDMSNCAGTCIQNWPAFSADKIVAPSFIDLSQFGSIVRSDTKNQTTFHHSPLYFYAQDKVHGDVKGQGVGGFWSTVDPFGTSSTK